MKFFKRTELNIFITVSIVLLFYISHYGGSYMADSMLSTTQAIIDTGSIQIDPYVKEGCVNTTSKSTYGCDHALYKGHWYSGFAPGSSFIALPSYLVLKPFTYLVPEFVSGYPKVQIDTILLNIFATILIIIPLSALLSVLIYRTTKNFVKNKKYRIMTSILFSFGTLFFYYSTEFDARVLATFFSFLSFYILFNGRIGTIKNSHLFIAGILSSIAVTVEYTQVIVSGILFLYLISFVRDKRVIHYIFGAMIPILLMFAYHYAAFDNILHTGYDYRQGEDKGIINESTFSNLNASNIWSYTFSPKYGIFFYMPILLLALYGLFIGFKERKEYWREWGFILLVLLCYLVFIASFTSESGCTFGPRYLIPIIPFMFLALPLVLEKIKLWIVLVVGFVSFLINYLPVLYMIENTGCEPGFVVLKNFISRIPGKGLTNYTFNLINQEIIKLDYILVNLISIVILMIIAVIIWKIWKQ